MTLKQIQQEQKAWVAHNFGGRPSWQPLLGAVEELGELAHAHLKEVQRIRVNEDHTAAKRDALGDILIFLCDYATAEGFDLEDVVSTTWEQVRQRDWKRNPHNGQTETKIS